MRVSPWRPEWTKGDLPLHVLHTPRVGGHDQQQHLFHELVYVVRGHGRHHDAGGGHRLRGGDLVLLHPQSWHAYSDCHGMETYVCVWHPQLLARFGALMQQLGPLFAHLRRRWPRPIDQPPLIRPVPPRLRGRIASAFEDILEEFETREPGWQAACLARLVDVLVLVGRLLERGEDVTAIRPGDRGEWAVQSCVDLIEQRPAEAWSLVELAQRVELSPWQLSRRFRERMGLGLPGYLQQLRIDEACRRLALTDDAITTIALTVGFDDPAYFSRVFKRITGRTPRAYRRGLEGD